MWIRRLFCRSSRPDRACTRALAGVLVALLSSACSHPGTLRDNAPARHDARTQLSIGYSLLYQEADGIPKLKWLLLFKEKSRRWPR